MDPHKRDDSTYASGTPTVTFDFCHTKSVPAGHKPQDIKSLCCLVMVCSQTGYLHVTPVRHKNQFDLMVRVGRLRPLAGSLMHALGAKLGLEISTNSHLWTWGMCHAAWIINRFSVTPGRGMTSFEMLANKPHTGKVCQFGEPVFAYQKTKSKGNAKWRRMICLGKVDPQDSFLVLSGENLILHKAHQHLLERASCFFYLNLKCASYDFKSGFGGRVAPTKSSRAPIAPVFNVPTGEIEPSKFFDEDAHAVRQKALEEQRENFEAAGMAVHDKKILSEEIEQPLQEFGAEAVSFPNPIVIFDDDEDGGDGQNDAGGDEADVELRPNPIFSGLAVAPTPPELINPAPISPSTAAPVSAAAASFPSSMGSQHVPVTPRASPITRVHGQEEQSDDQSHKRPRVAYAKKARLMQIKTQYARMINAVSFDDGSEFHTMDDYSQDLRLNDHEDEDDHWQDDSATFTAMPVGFWSDCGVSVKPDEPPEHIDDLADEVAIARLCSMGVIQHAKDFAGDAVDEHKLGTKFVRDRRLKQKWFRRSRLVAREFAFLEKRQDVYSPASSTHILNLLPLMWLKRQSDMDEVAGGTTAEEQVLATLDVQDAFLEVPQPTPLKVWFNNQRFVVLRNLPGQRLGARAWYWFIRQYLIDKMQFEWCSIHACLARSKDSVILLHVDDVLYVGNQAQWKEFKDTLQQRFTISHAVLGGVGSEVSFLKRRIVYLSEGLAASVGPWKQHQQACECLRDEVWEGTCFQCTSGPRTSDD